MGASMQDKTYSPIHVVGGGLAGSEAAWQIAESGVPVILHEMRGVRGRKRTRAIRWRNWSVPTPSAPTMRPPMQWASSMRKCGLPAR